MAAAWRGRACAASDLAAGELCGFAGEPAPHFGDRFEQLGAGAFGRGSREDGFRVLEAGMPTERDVAEAEQREPADGGFEAAATE